MTQIFWGRLFLVISAIIIGTWVPLRLLYFHDYQYLDMVLEAYTFALIVSYYRLRKKQKLESRLSKIIFCVDCIIAAPLSLIFTPILGSSAPLLLLTKLIILKRLNYVRDLLNEFDSLHPIVFRLIPVAVFMPMLVHIIACGWIALGSGTAGHDPNALTEYIRGVYWTFSTLTTVGYGDISAKYPLQMIYASVTQIMGVGVFGFILSNVASVLSRLDAAREHHLAMIDRTETYMRYNDLPTEVRTQVRGYYKYLWKSHQGYDDSEVLEALPRKLRAEISFFMNREIIEKVPFLHGADADLVQDLVLQLKPMVCIPGEKIFEFGDPGIAMYFIHSGSVEIVAKEGNVLANLTSGSFFGELALITTGQRSAKARAVTYCDLFVLEKSAFESSVRNFPEFEKFIDKVAAERMKSNSRKVS